jgi:hypothetical protein
MVRILLAVGIIVKYSLSNPHSANRQVFFLFYWSWILISTFIMLNIILAIIVDAYATVKSQMVRSCHLTSILTSI